MTPRIHSGTHNEGLKAARLLMVLSSISPLFILWAIRGNSLVPDRYFISFCALMVLLPNAFLWLRIKTAQKQADKHNLIVGKVEDHNDDILSYLFAIMLPFYSADLGNWRDLIATLAAIAFIVFLFWHLNLHYMNIFFAALGYRVFMVFPPSDNNPITGKSRYIVITPRVYISTGERICAYRLSNTVFLEVKI